ncbi:Oligopeptide transport ATP-binding protein AppF [Nymphon striatum]|nr:Oligopeptide transport ATP-binding protein AppF [Nymphon striatum]
MTEPLLTVQDLRVEFTLRRKTLLGPKPILKAVDGVSFTVNKGETLAIVGESGSGKTTAALAIARLVNTAGGTVHLEGQELLALEGQDLLKMREKVQFIFQDPYSSLNPRKRAEDLVREPLDSLTDKTTDEKQTIIDDLFAAVGLRKEQQRLFPHQFSGGQRQRIGIARALATQPRVIICDEPVSALDVAVQAQILNLLRRLQTDFGLTYLFISHDLGVVQYVSDKIAVMYMGKIVELADRLSLPFSNNNGRDDKKIVIWAYRKWVLFLNMNRLHLPPKGMINDSFRSNFPWHFNAWGQFDPACLCVVEQHAIVVTRCEMAADFPRNPSDRGTGWLYGCCYFAVAWIADMALGRRLDWFRRIFKHARGALFLGGNLHNAAPIASHQPILGWQAPSFHSWQKAPYYRAPRRPASQPQNRSGCDGQGSLLTYLVYLFIQKAAYCAFVFRLGVITADDEFKIDISGRCWLSSGPRLEPDQNTPCRKRHRAMQRHLLTTTARSQRPSATACTFDISSLRAEINMSSADEASSGPHQQICTFLSWKIRDCHLQTADHFGGFGSGTVQCGSFRSDQYFGKHVPRLPSNRNDLRALAKFGQAAFRQQDHLGSHGAKYQPPHNNRRRCHKGKSAKDQRQPHHHRAEYFGGNRTHAHDLWWCEQYPRTASQTCAKIGKTSQKSAQVCQGRLASGVHRLE